MGQGPQHSVLPDAHEWVVAQPNRESIHGLEEVRPTAVGLSQPQRAAGGHRKLSDLAQSAPSPLDHRMEWVPTRNRHGSLRLWRRKLPRSNGTSTRAETWPGFPWLSWLLRASVSLWFKSYWSDSQIKWQEP